MKIFFVSFVLLSIIYGLEGHCVRHRPGSNCQERIFPEPEPRDIHYIYRGETCDCPKYHDVRVEQPVPCDKKHQPGNYEYNVQVPKKNKEEQVTRYMFDVLIEKPVEKQPEGPLGSYNYKLQSPKKATEEQPVRYIFDTRVEKPVEPCQDKPWQGLVAQVDRISLPARDCQNTDHSPETCDCGCRNPSHTPETCTCGSNNYKLPIIYNSRYDSQPDNSQNIPIYTFPDSMSLPKEFEAPSRKVKRDVNPEKKRKSKRRELKLPKLKPLKKISSKNVKLIRDPEQLLKPLKTSKSRLASQLRSKRKQESPCGYTYESCDPKKHNRDGCPLCYRCKCEPINQQTDDQKFSPYDIKVPYKLVTHDEAPGSAASNQEFDNEPPSYTGLKEQDMYKKYIKQIVSKYPEHMARKMPDMQEQQRDLLKFIDEVAKSNKSPGKTIENEDVRYKMMDNAMDMYKYYEKSLNMMPKTPVGNNGKLFKKRGTVLEVIEIDPEDFDGHSYKIAADELMENDYESQY